MSIAYLGLGSNLGDRVGYLRTALDLLMDTGQIAVIAVSSLYETAPMEIADQPAFINAVAVIQTTLRPGDLLHVLKHIERVVGRRERFRFGPREIDVDILLYDELVLISDKLTIPHPRLAGRAFALVPLTEVAPGYRLPGTENALADLLPAALALGTVEHRQGPTWYQPRPPALSASLPDTLLPRGEVKTGDASLPSTPEGYRFPVVDEDDQTPTKRRER